MLLQRLLEIGSTLAAGCIAGLIASNVIFGLLHFLTPTYAILAGLMGLYFGLLLDATHPPNLATAMIAHGVYDYLAFLLFSLRRPEGSDIPGPPSSLPASEPYPTDPCAERVASGLRRDRKSLPSPSPLGEGRPATSSLRV